MEIISKSLRGELTVLDVFVVITGVL